MRIVFMGTPDFAVPVLDALVEAGHEVVAAYCQPARPGGRRGRLGPRRWGYPCGRRCR
jgi:methionyl-tRNA formyltransferase